MTSAGPNLNLEALGARASRRDRRRPRFERVGADPRRRARQEGARLGADEQARRRLPPEERKTFGQTVNDLKGRSHRGARSAQKLCSRRGALDARLTTERADVTLPVRLGPRRGGAHPSRQPGASTRSSRSSPTWASPSPKVRTSRRTTMNFTKLNIPPEHPARQEHDTFYFRAEARRLARSLLRTHTSPVQIRTMVSQKPPIRIIAPGRVYRCDSDQTHTPMFHQIEGLVIDETTHMGHLKWVLRGVLQGVLRGRRREDALPRLALPVHRAVVPKSTSAPKRSASRVSGSKSSAAAWCIRTCSATAVSIPEKYQGFAFGMGLDRLDDAEIRHPRSARVLLRRPDAGCSHYGFSMLDVPTPRRRTVVLKCANK